MGVADSPLRDRVVFVEGAARSGTSWLSVLLATHPDVAGIGSESHLFDIGLDRLFRNHESGNYFLEAYVSRAELVDMARDLADGVLLRMRARTKPEARLVMEKTPIVGAARPVVERKLECFPDAWYLHVVRDGDAVARSLARAPFVEDRSHDACLRLWREAVEAIREAAGDHPRYREIRYEDLTADPPAALAGVFDWLGVSAGEPVLERVARLSRERYAKPLAPESRPRRGRLERVRQKVRSRRQGTATDERPGNGPAPEQVLYDRLLMATGEEDLAALRHLTADGFSFELRSGGGHVRVVGEEARVALVEELAPLFRRGAFVDVAWDMAEGSPFATAIFTGIGPDGSRADLSLHLFAREGKAARLVAVSAGIPR